MNVNSRNIKIELNKSLQLLRKSKDQVFASEVKCILETNFDRGRINSFIEGNLDQVPGYVERVITYYSKLKSYIQELQVERTTHLWEPLFKKMHKWAYNYFLKKNFKNSLDTQEIAYECATEAAINILSARFPYDTDFEPWAYVIVQHACLKYIRKATRTSVVPSQNLVSLDSVLSFLKDPIAPQLERQRELKDELMKMISELPEARQRVIELLYLEEMPPAEVAKIMGKNVSAIYSLRFNALNDLQKNYKNRNIYYE
jgi:RNA polymerase sigma factor (sigma-70 family)